MDIAVDGTRTLVLIFSISLRRPSFLTGADVSSYFVGPAKSALRMKQVTFTGGPSFRANGSIFIPNPDTVKYVGTPTPEIDEAWELLTGGK
jgi:hypothetical protein